MILEEQIWRWEDVLHAYATRPSIRPLPPKAHKLLEAAQEAMPLLIKEIRRLRGE